MIDALKAWGLGLSAAPFWTDVAWPVIWILLGIVAIVACSLVLSALFGMNGVWAAFPASEAITACLTLFLLKRKKRTA